MFSLSGFFRLRRLWGMMSDDTTANASADLLARFCATRDEGAFRGMVMAAALRRTGGDAALAEEVAQEVFCRLARGARCIREAGALPGWLHRAACGCAADAVRREKRRRERERVATVMNEPEESAFDWAGVAPVIDEAVDALPEVDRRLVVLRYFEGHSQRDAGAVLGMAEDAARKRLQRALEKLRGALARRGITGTAAALAVTLTAHAGPALVAPPVAAKLVRAGLAAPALTGAALFLQNFGALFLMLMKQKIALPVIAALLAAVPVTLLWLENHALQARLSVLEQGTPRAHAAAAVSPAGIPAATASAAAKTGEKQPDEPSVAVVLSEDTIESIDLPVLDNLTLLTISPGVCQLFKISEAGAERVNTAMRRCVDAMKALDTAHLRKVEDRENGVVFEIPAYPEGRAVRDAMIMEIESALGSKRAAWFMPKLAYATDWQLGRWGSMTRRYDVRFEDTDTTTADGKETKSEYCIVDVKWDWPDGAEGEAGEAAEHPMLQEIARRQKGSLHRILHEMGKEGGDPVAGHPLGHLFRVEDIRR